MFYNFSIQMPGVDVRLAMMKLHADLDSHCRSWRASIYDPDRRLDASKASPRIASTYLDGMSRFAKASLGRWVSPMCLAYRGTAATVMSPTHQDPWSHSDLTEKGTALSLE